MKSEWSDQKADPYTVDLSDSPLKAVAHYVRWLYSSKLDMEVDIPDNSNASGKLEQNQGVEKLYEALVEAYIFGEKIMDATYTRAILGEVIQTNNQYLRSPGPSVLSKLYDGTVPGCLARRLFARFVAYNYFCDPEWNNYLEGYPRDLLVDVIKVRASLRGTLATPWREDVNFIDKI